MSNKTPKKIPHTKGVQAQGSTFKYTTESTTYTVDDCNSYSITDVAVV